MRSFLSLLLAVCLAASCGISSTASAEVALPSSALTSLTHNCPNTAIMLPEAFSPLEDTYLLTVASWVSRVMLTPVSADPNAVLALNGLAGLSGTPSQIFEMNDEPQTVTISVVSSDGSSSVYTVYLQRRPSSARTGVAAGFLTAVEQEDGITYLVMDLVTVTYQGDHVSSFTNDNVPDRYRYPAAAECVFYYGGTDNPVMAKNADDFKAQIALNGTELFSVIYIQDEIVSVWPFSSDLTAIQMEPAAGFISVTPPPGGGYALLREGSIGALVVQLQLALKARAFYKGSIDGLYGAGLRDAVKAFQLAYGLVQDGDAGEDTQRLLYEGVVPSGTKVASPTPEATPITTFVTVTAPPDGGMITLKEGDEGILVKNLQQALTDQGYYKGQADGFYGSETRESVISFQHARHLVEDGMAGIDTQSALYAELGQAGNPPAVTPVPFTANVTAAPNGDYVTLRQGNIGALVIMLQQQLKAKGYYKGEVDGIFGEETKEAVISFQLDNGLSQDGEASPAVLLTLYEGDNPDKS